MVKTEFMDLYEELGVLNEAYHIPYSGYVIVNEDGEYFSKEFLDTGNLRKAFTDDIREAAVYKDEDKAYRARTYCFQLYNEKLDFWVKYVESESELEQGEIERKLFEILDLWGDFINAGVIFQKLCNKDDFKDFGYTEADYKNKKQVPGLLGHTIYNEDAADDMARRLSIFMQEVIKASNRAEDDKELYEKATNFVQTWNAVIQKVWRDIPGSIRQQVFELLKNL